METEMENHLREELCVLDYTLLGREVGRGYLTQWSPGKDSQVDEKSSCAHAHHLLAFGGSSMVMMWNGQCRFLLKKGSTLPSTVIDPV